MATPSVRCPQCGTTYPVAADLLGKGKRGRCKQCQTVFPLDPALVPPTQPAPAPASTAADSLGPGLLADVAIEKELGRGGMGKVYLVRRASDGQRFALKRVLVRGEPARRQFLTELRTWIDLPTHPHLAACRFFRTAGEEVAIFAEYVAGGSLDAWLTAGRMPGLAERLDVAIQTAWGLHAAHEWGVIHQDVKPANVLLAEEPNPPGPPSQRGEGGLGLRPPSPRSPTSAWRGPRG
jgi:predicted Zn finger-like uncharacterized protein